MVHFRDKWTPSHNDCLPHGLAHVYKKTFALMGSNIKGMCKWSVSLQASVGLNMWRASIYAEVRPRVQLI